MKIGIAKTLFGMRNSGGKENQEELERPVRWIREGANSWRVVYADQEIL